MTSTRSGVLYLLAAGLLAYLFASGNLDRVKAYALRASGGTPDPSIALRPQGPITLPRFGPAGRRPGPGKI